MTRASNRPVARLLGYLVISSAVLASSPARAEAQAGSSGPALYADLEMARLGSLLEEEIAEPRAILHLADLGRVVDEVTDLAALRGIFARAALDRRAHPEVRAYARLLAANTEWRRGRLPRSRQWMEPLGIVSDLWFVGPFDNEGGSGFDVVWPPEREELLGAQPDPAASYTGKEGLVSWRAMPDIFPLGWVDLSSLVDPDREVVVYLRAVVVSERAQPAALRIGMPGPVKVWREGEEIFASTADHPTRFDQYAVPVNLDEGSNVFLIKLSQRQGWLGFYLRLSDVTGGVLRGVTPLSGDSARPARAAPARRPELPTVDTVLEAFLAAAESAPGDPVVLADYARALSHRHPFDRTERKPLEAAKAALAAALALRAQGAAAGSSTDPEPARFHQLVAAFEEDQNRRRLALEAAIAADPDHLPSLLDLGLYRLGRGDARAALPHLRRVVELSPGHLQAALALIDAEAHLGFSEQERRRVSELAAEFPMSPSMISREAMLALDDGRSDRAADRLRVGVGLYPGDRGLRAALISALLDLGRLDEAVEMMEEGLRFDPANVHGRLGLADLLSTNGRLEQAEALYDAAAAQRPDMADVHLRRAWHHLRHGFRPGAEEHLEKAFARRPQDPRISELRTILAEEEQDPLSPYLKDAAALAAEARQRGPIEGEDVVTLAEVTAVRVHRSGLSTRLHQEVYEVLTPRGVERMRSRSVSYTPGDQILRMEQARVIRPDGSVMQARSEHERSLSEPWARLYFDQRARVLNFPDLSPGDVVEVVWRREDVSFANMFGDYFGDLTFFQSTSPIAHKAYVLVAPADRRFHFNEISLPGVEYAEETREDGTSVRSWTASDIAKIVPEPGMPGWAESAALLHVSTYETWQEVAGWWWRLIEEQLRPSRTLSALAHELVAGIPEEDVRARVAAIHNYVVTQTRYVGLEFGIHGFKPYRVDQIHERRFGDCKDKSALTFALLRSIGIDSRMVILRMRRLGRIPDFPASLAVFNHAILYVPGLDLWLDGTAEFAGTGELPSQDHDAAILVVDQDNLENSWFGYVPVPPADQSVSVTELAVALQGDGSASAEGSFEVLGSAAPGYRRAYQAAEQQRHLYEQEWARAHPGVEVKDLELQGLDDLEAPVTATFGLSLPRFARGDQERLSFRPLGEGRGYGERFAALSSRNHDLIIAFPFLTRHVVRVELPAGWQVAELPDSVELESEHGALSIDYRVVGDTVTVEAQVAFTTSRVKAEEYQAFREFLGRVDRAIAREIRLVPAQRRAATR